MSHRIAKSQTTREALSILTQTVLGCPLPVHTGMTTTVTVSGDVATVVCNITRQVWILSCHGNRWIDQSPGGHNCSPPVVSG